MLPLSSATLSGQFKCRVTDFGEFQERTIEVTVNNYPRVQLDPMSVSVKKGQPVNLKCLSPDDSWLKFKYEWFRVGIYHQTLRPDKLQYWFSRN